MFIIISIVALVALTLHLSGLYKFDDVALVLLFLSVVPWLISAGFHIELPGGWKIAIQKMEARIANERKSERYSERGYVYLVHEDRRDIPLALHYLERAVSTDPNNSIARGRYAMALKAKGKLRLALREVSKALEIDNDDEILHYNRACYASLLRLNEEEIFDSLEEAISRFSGFAKFARNDEDLEYARTKYAERFIQLIGGEEQNGVET